MSLVACAALASCGGDGLPITTATPPPAPQRQTAPVEPAPQAPPPPAASAPAVPAQESAPVSAPGPLTTKRAHSAAPARPADAEDELVRRLRQLDLDALEQSLATSAFDDPNLPAIEEDEGSLLDEITQDSIPEDVDIAQWREERLRKTQSDLPLTLNADVIRLVNYFSEGKGRGTIRATLGRAGAFRATIERILEEEDVPKELFYLAQAESGFRPKARSYARATGMWQFMAFRGKQYGLRQDRYLEERYDFEKATRAAARHLKDLYIEFGDWYLALAAYNAGPGRVTRAIQRGNTRDYWEMCRKQLLPKQTRDYVPIILAMAYIDKNLDMYDVGVIDYAPPRKFDTVRIASEASLELIADIAKTTVTDLEQLNESLLRSATPPYEYDLRLPPGAGEGFLAKFESVPADKRMQWRFHDAEEDILITELARRYKVSPEQLIAVNGLEPGTSVVPAGSALHIPTETKLRVFRGPATGGGSTESGGGRYRVASGDTLGTISRRFGVTVAQLKAWNGLPDTRIRAGRYLIVNPNGGSSVDDVDERPVADGVYQVRRGETLGSIAKRHGLTLSQLQARNGLRSTRIQVGDKLKVPGARLSSSAPTRAAASAPATPGGKYRVRAGDNLAAIAGRFGVTVAQLQAWNRLSGTRINAGQDLIVGAGAPAEPAPAVASEPVRSANSGRRYTVKSGDSLGAIASRFNTTPTNLRTWNGLRSNIIRPGQSLIVDPNAAAAPSPVETASASRPAQQAPTSRPASTSTEVEYRIRPGDTLGGIADRFGVTTSELRSWNKIRGNRIVAGQMLIVRAPGGPVQVASLAPAAAPQAARAASSSGGAERYRVQSGDTLASIAQRHAVSVDDLMAWNGLSSSRLTVGQSLLMRAPATGSRYQIRPGDTLEIIAKRFSVSVDELMRWNALNSTRIRAGMYLTIRYSERASGGAD